MRQKKQGDIREADRAGWNRWGQVKEIELYSGGSWQQRRDFKQGSFDFRRKMKVTIFLIIMVLSLLNFRTLSFMLFISSS